MSIKVVGLEKAFGKNRVLRGVDLEINEGETITIMGGSGTGKSVLIKHMVGLMKPDKGRLYVDGKEITSMNEDQLFQVQRQFGYLFQGAALFDSLTVGENIAFGIKISGRICDYASKIWWWRNWSWWVFGPTSPRSNRRSFPAE